MLIIFPSRYVIRPCMSVLETPYVRKPSCSEPLCRFLFTRRTTCSADFLLSLCRSLWIPQFSYFSPPAVLPFEMASNFSSELGQRENLPLSPIRGQTLDQFLVLQFPERITYMAQMKFGLGGDVLRSPRLLAQAPDNRLSVLTGEDESQYVPTSPVQIEHRSVGTFYIRDNYQMVTICILRVQP